jgi:hypothetical protein
LPEVPEQASREVLVGKNRRVNLVRLAHAQRRLLRLVLAMVALYPLAIVIPSFFPYREVLYFVFPLLGLIALVIAVLIILQTVRLAIASGRNPTIAAIAGFLMLVPLLGLILVASADSRASNILRKNGARVGFLGVSESEMLKLTLGYCRNCGYPLAGLTADRCPECGEVRSAAA